MPLPTRIQPEPIPGYKLLERLGSGGFGEVWKVEAPGGMHKAIKFVYGDLRQGDKSGARNAEQELKALARVKTIRHPFIVSLERVDIIDGQLIIVMELADQNLWDRFRECREKGTPGIPRDELLRYMKEAAEALDLMNIKYDLQHLDIKPQNLFLVQNHIKVADFGLVKDMSSLSTSAQLTGGVTPAYAAPETFEGRVTRFSDQYGLAVVYQELLTGQRPYSGQNIQELVTQCLHKDPDLESLPTMDRPIVAKALSKVPDERFSTCLDFVRALLKANRETRRINLAEFRQGLQELQGQQLQELEEEEEAEIDDTPADVRIPRGAPSQPYTVLTEEEAHRQRAHLDRVEERGDGVLFPALVIGLGSVGYGVLRHLRADLQNRFGPLTDLPHLRMLYVDTDSESAQALMAEGSVKQDESLVVRLNRAARYQRPREGMPPLKDWLDPKLVYRIPRNPTTAGIRALGRLAFLDHYKSIVARLQRDLEQIVSPDALETSARGSGLKLRTNFPRVYIVASLGGGTGSGMFLDLAYVVRDQLRRLGYGRQEVVGLFVLPPVDENPEQILALANTYAALVELNHFRTPGQTFYAVYDPRSGPLGDSAPPFIRCMLRQLPDKAEQAYFGDLEATMGEYLMHELVTPLSSVADQAVEGQPPERFRFHTFGLHALSSPRRRLVERSARRLCRVMMDQWTGKAKPEQGGPIQQEMKEQLQKLQVSPELVLEKLEAACARELGKPAEEFFRKAVEPIQNVTPPAVPDVAAGREVMRQADDLLGSPDEAANFLRPTRVAIVLRQTAEQLVKTASQPLADFILRYLDRPSYRVGGAEEAVRQTFAILEEWIQQYRTQIDRLTNDLKENGLQLQATIAEIGKLSSGGKLSGGKIRQNIDLAEPVRLYAMLRCQQLLAQRMCGIYLSLRGQVSDLMKELSFFRHQLRELDRFFQDEPENREAVQATQSEDRLLKGSVTLDEAVDQVVKGLSEEELDHIDRHIQHVFEGLFPGLAQLCMTSSDQFRNLPMVMLRELDGILELRLPLYDAAKLFCEESADDAAVTEAIVKAFDKAVPPLVKQRLPFEHETCIIAVPNSEAGQRLLELAQQAIPSTKAILNENKDEVVFFREYVGLAFWQLQQLGPLGQEAYERTCALEHFTPHTRTDIPRWQPLPAHQAAVPAAGGQTRAVDVFLRKRS